VTSVIPSHLPSGPNRSQTPAKTVRTDHSRLLPFEQLVFALLQTCKSEDALTMHFDTHEIMLPGASLAGIEGALRRRESAHLVTIPAQCRAKLKEGQPPITTVDVVTDPAAGFKTPGLRANSDEEALHENDH
jgi:hypothetical protein